MLNNTQSWVDLGQPSGRQGQVYPVFSVVWPGNPSKKEKIWFHHLRLYTDPLREERLVSCWYGNESRQGNNTQTHKYTIYFSSTAKLWHTNVSLLINDSWALRLLAGTEGCVGLEISGADQRGRGGPVKDTTHWVFLWHFSGCVSSFCFVFYCWICSVAQVRLENIRFFMV